MGVSELWSLLKSVGNIQSISGSEGAHTAILQEVQGRAVAVDLSGWVVQATCQPDLAQAFNDPDSQALSVSFNRAVNHLRYECAPVAITEGRAPAEKLERLQQRFKARTGLDGGGRGNQYFTAMGTAVAGMLDSLGLPVVQAPGEGEAMCAALNAAGLVHACATCDGDVLLFGAQTTFHTLKLQSSDPQNSEIAKVELAWVQQMLGIGAGGANALIALSLLSGGDYAVKGAQQVGARSAVRLVQHLLQGSQDDHEVLDQLMDLVSYPPDPAMEALSAQGCTGCKLCKHPGNRKSSIAKHSRRNPCRCCPPDFVSEHHTCQPRPDMPCQCDFHTKETLRLIDKAVRRIQATVDFRRKAADAAAAYHRQRQQATAAVELVRCRYRLAAGQAFQWMHRPNVQQAAQHLSFWSEEVVRGKLMPLLMQWDMCHPDAVGCEWVARAINKVHVQKAAKEEDCWRYIMHWHRLPDVHPETVEADNAWLKRSESHHRAIKMSLVQQHCPHLISQFEQQQRDKADKKNGVSKKTAASKAAVGTASITSFYSQQKKPTSMTALPTKGIPDVSEQPRGVKPPRGLAAAMGGGAAPLGPRGRGGDPDDSLGGASLAPKQGALRGGDPGGIPGGSSLAPQPKLGTLRSKFASQSANDSRQSVSKPANTVLGQPGLDCSVQAKPTAQLPTGTSSADPQTSDRGVEDDLMLQSPYAMRLRQKQGGQAAQLSQMCTSSSPRACYGDRDVDRAAGSSRQLEHYNTVDLAGNRPRPQQHQEQQVGKHCGHQPFEGQLGTGSSRAGHLPRSSGAVTPRGQLMLSPKRGIRSCEKEGPSTAMSDGDSEGELEISLLSPSPAKRRKTPPSSPDPHPHPRSLSGVSEDEHRLCPAGPAPSSCFPEEAQPNPRGCCLRDSIGHAAIRKDIFRQTAGCKDSKHEENQVLNCVSPESGQDEGTPLQPTGISPVNHMPQHAQHSTAAGQRWRNELCSGSGTAAEEKAGTQLRAGGQAVHVRQQAADCSGDQSAGVPDLEVPRPRQVSRRGKGRAMPCYRAPGMPVTLDSGRFGFVKLPSPRAGPSEVTQPQQLQTVQAENKARPSNCEASGDNVFVLSQPSKAASSYPAAHDSVAVVDTTSTVARADLELPITPSGSPVGAVESSLHQGSQQNDKHQDGLSKSQGHQRCAEGKVGGQVDSQLGVVSPSLDVTPVHHRCAIGSQSMLSVSASPIDLLTPSTGAVSTVATPTFSESSEVCDLTQD